MIVAKTYDDEIKCGGCNYRFHILYGHDGTNFTPDEEGMTEGLCSECFLESLMEAQG